MGSSAVSFWSHSLSHCLPYCRVHQALRAWRLVLTPNTISQFRPVSESYNLTLDADTAGGHVEASTSSTILVSFYFGEFDAWSTPEVFFSGANIGDAIPTLCTMFTADRAHGIGTVFYCGQRSGSSACRVGVVAGVV